MKTIPSDFTRYEESIMSNFDHIINREVADAIRGKKLYAGYPAWDFWGGVWFEGGKWYCQVKRHTQHIDTLEGSTLEEIQEQACRLYGAD